jgi:hypothetical protein
MQGREGINSRQYGSHPDRWGLSEQGVTLNGAGGVEPQGSGWWLVVAVVQ